MIRIQPFIQKILEAMSTILDVEITVVDNNLERIAGTGQFKSEIGNKIPECYGLAKVIKTGNYYIIDNPGQNPLCENCPHFMHCTEGAAIALPIISRKRTLGAISFVSFNEIQRIRLLKSQDNLLLFLKHFSELISSKVSEEEFSVESQLVTEQLKGVINTINEGIVVTNKKGDVVLINSYVTRKIDSHVQEGWLNKPLMKVIAGIPLERVIGLGETINYQKGNIKNKDNSFQIIYSLTPILIAGEIAGSILNFHIAEDAQKLAFKINRLKDLITFDDLLGISEVFKAAKSKAKIVASGDSTILLLGESGTGKELFARAIHFASNRNRGPFIAINCAAIPDSLLEAELFGYEYGAFTNARKEGKPGKFELADNGTVLLDEIGDMNTGMQAKLLRFLEEKSFERLGGTKQIMVDARIIASTSKNIDEMVEKGNFRRDLFYRISTIPIALPPLRQRKEDIPIYLDLFRRNFNLKFDKEIKGCTKEAEKILIEYNWPGNVREIKNVIEYTMNMEQTPYINLDNLPERIRNKKIFVQSHFTALGNQECSAIVNGLIKFGKTTIGKRKAANEMHMSLASFYRKIKKYDLNKVWEE